MATESSDLEPVGFTPQEEKELRRVYEELAGYGRRCKLQAEIATKNEVAQAEIAKSNEVASENKILKARNTSIAFDDRLQRTTEAEITRLKAELTALDKKSDRKVNAEDLTLALTRLGKHSTEKEVEDMIWEVDENLDSMVDWEEFKLMFKRNVNDKTGLEPSKLFNLVQFMIYDQNGNGLVSVDETCSMLYARYGRMKMETKLRELFGEEMRESGKEGGEIDFLAYCKAVQKIKLNSFWSSPQGKLVMTSRYTGGGSLKREKDNEMELLGEAGAATASAH